MSGLVNGALRFSLAAFVSGCFLLLAQQPAEKPPEKGRVEGTVVKAGTNEPLRRALVILQRPESRAPAQSTWTDAAGRFSFADLEPGRYRLQVERKGCVRQEYGQRGRSGPGSLLTLSAPAGARSAFPAVPSGVIAGRVNDEEGEPTPGVVVQVMRFVYSRGALQLVTFARDVTNDLGEYRIFDLASGKYFVSANYVPGSRQSSFGRYAGPGQAAEDVRAEVFAPVFYRAPATRLEP